MTFSDPIALLLIVTLVISIIVQILNILLLREMFHYLRNSHGAIHSRLDYLVGKLDILPESLRKIYGCGDR